MSYVEIEYRIRNYRVIDPVTNRISEEYKILTTQLATMYAGS